MDTNKILKRVSEADKLRAAGLTDEEIRELKGLQNDHEAQIEERAAKLKDVEEYTRLRDLSEAGLLDDDE